MKTSLLSLLTSIGKTGFQAFAMISLTILKLIFLGDMILASRMMLGGMLVSWFGGSSNLISCHEHFSVLDTRSDTSMVEA